MVYTLYEPTEYSWNAARFYRFPGANFGRSCEHYEKCSDRCLNDKLLP